MIILNIILICAGLGISSWLLLSYGNELVKAINVLFSGLESIFMVIIVIVFKTVKSIIIGGIIALVCAGIFKIAGAQISLLKAAAITVGIICFAFLMLKTFVEEWSNFYWSIRNVIRNKYR
ncbi:hypothetical protein H6F78_03225 [Coleofasciculus sp. FACHB-64]|uniref:hypothetical protein n=1 Tax=Cyanophyceae TaxID=3028117 RepID=UPI001684FC93|nr:MULTISPECIES: hypothetical protein [unclassified Coleofasciculus]MBD1839920.1 hypothetical protein [Coleofasciculus sp. FACHB-501]MBD1900001.1 hypothetical protein [Coleofasciculus sp. FACHB-125]MBD2044652.1 hypothetical protein [Coleofasciculus sp. FACHB-64]MBD2084206.1 hypothetical protein [Coleofasciculus sp. FACHB-542]